jgi:hypothetical protein
LLLGGSWACWRLVHGVGGWFVGLLAAGSWGWRLVHGVGDLIEMNLID